MSSQQTQATHNVKQAAKRLNISERAMRDLIARFEIRAYDVSLRPGTGRARWRIDEQAIQDFQQRRANARPEPAKPRKVARPTKQYV